MRPVQPGIAWSEEFAMRGVFAAESGRWTSSRQSCNVPAMTLLWNDDVRDKSDWTFECDEPSSMTQAWWLGFTPSA